MSVFIDRREGWERYGNPLLRMGAHGAVAFKKGQHLSLPRDDRVMIPLEDVGMIDQQTEAVERSRVPALKKLAFRRLVEMSFDAESLQQDFCDLARLGLPPCFTDKVPEVQVYPREYKPNDDDTVLRMSQVQYLRFEHIPMDDNVMFVSYMQARYREALYNVLMEWVQRAHLETFRMRETRAACVPFYQPYIKVSAQEYEDYTSLTILCIIKKLFATDLSPKVVAEWPISCPFVLE